MTRDEFLQVVAYITAGSGKSLASDSIAVYYDCLGDLPFEVLKLAAKRVVLEHRWATFPTVAELREAATKTAKGELTELSPAEAWELAWGAIGRIDPEVDGSFARATKDFPALVTRAIQVFGLSSLCHGNEPLTVVRAQFMRIFEQLASRERTAATLPAALTSAIEGRAALPAPVRQAIEGIGKEP